MQPTDQKRLEFNEGFKQLARGNFNLFAWKMILRRGRNKRAQFKEHIGKKLQTALCVINKG